jgi:hypothetical protein
MKKLSFRFIIALATFVIGVIATTLWILQQRPPKQAPVPIEAASIIQLDPRWVYMNEDIEWGSPPKYIEQAFKSGGASIVVFYPTGKVAIVDCTLYRDNRSKRVSISAGDDFSVSKGNWKLNGDGTITTTSRFTHSMVFNTPERIEHWAIREQAADRIAGRLEMNGQFYIPISNVGGFDQLSPMIADDNQR